MQNSLLRYFGQSEIKFDQFMIKTPSLEVLKEGKPIKLEPQLLSFLLLLIRHKDHIVSREEIVSEIWSDKKASDDAIRALVKKLRIVLGDNARAPKFIKTVPLQGYLFITPVHIEFFQAQWWRKKYVLYTLSIFLVILFTLIIQAQFGSFQRTDQRSVPKVNVSKLSEMKGSEVSPYLSKSNALLFSHRGPDENSLQLYVKNINSSVQKRLTWSKADFVDGIFSPDATQAVVKRRVNNNETLLLFDFDDAFNIVNVTPIELDDKLAFQQVDAISYSANGQELFLYIDGYNNKSNSETGIVTEHTRQVLVRYNIQLKRSTLLSLPTSKGARIIKAKESLDGKLLAVLARADNFAELHVQNLITNEIKLTKRMPRLSNSFVWSLDSDSITFATDSGNLLNINLGKQRFFRWKELPFIVSEVVSQCGEQCFVVKEQENNVSNIVERPLDFNSDTLMSMSEFRLSSEDKFPTYFAQGRGIYFLSFTEDSLEINKYVGSGDVESVYTLPRTSSIETFVLSPDGKKFAGELGGRIFIYDIGLSTLTFISSGARKTTNPVWSLQSDVIFYHQSQDALSTIYAHDIVSGKIKEKASGLSFIKPISADKWLLVDDKLQAYFYETDEASQQNTTQQIRMSPDTLLNATKISSLDSIASNAFDAENGHLFFITSSRDTRFLNQFSVETKQLKTTKLSGFSALSQIDVHPQMQKMLLVESSLSKSNLLRVDGLSLAPRKVNQVVTETP